MISVRVASSSPRCRPRVLKISYLRELRVLGFTSIACTRASTIGITIFSSLAVDSDHHRVHDSLEFLLFLTIFISTCILVLLQPFDCALHSLLHLCFLLLGELLFQILPLKRSSD